MHGTASLAGRASTHAWTEIYLPALGWRGLRSDDRRSGRARHVVTGVSQHPRGVMPVSGTFTGARGLFLGMDVEVATRDLSAAPLAQLAR